MATRLPVSYESSTTDTFDSIDSSDVGKRHFFLYDSAVSLAFFPSLVINTIMASTTATVMNDYNIY